MSIRECRKRVVALAEAVLNETTEDYTPIDRWTDDDWYMFQYASATNEQAEILRSLTNASGSLVTEKVKGVGHQLLSGAHNAFSMEECRPSYHLRFKGKNWGLPTPLVGDSSEHFCPYSQKDEVRVG